MMKLLLPLLLASTISTACEVTYSLNYPNLGNTVVTDGKNSLTVQISKGNYTKYSVLIDGVRLHEMVHIKQFYDLACNPEILQNQPHGKPISIIGRNAHAISKVLETQAYTFEKIFLLKKLDESTDWLEKGAIKFRIEQVNEQLEINKP